MDKMTFEAKNVLEESQVIAGYTVYVDLLRDFLGDKEYIVTGMTKETDRCRMALTSAAEGKTTAVVCSGDAGVYGMAGICLELSVDYPEVEIVVVPGVTAALSGGALLGAPLGHDFAVISLSDLLTPWETIEKRLKGAAMADFAICLYNPSSKKRSDYLKKACEIIMQYQPENIICGYAKNIGREGEGYAITTLGELKDTRVDMFTTVFIGNSKTKQIGNRMVTPRGYREV
jgi:precorrin-3B C17-methyltransferase